jgi:tellurite resistance protein TerC
MEILLTYCSLASRCGCGLIFLTIVIALMAFDLGVLNKDNHELGVAESLKMSVFYIFIAVLYSAATSGGPGRTGRWSPVTGPTRWPRYFQGYIIEKVLSIDNVFVISLIFGYFAIPRKYQYRALVWGIIGVIVLRGIMIAIGAELVSTYSWVTLIFAAFLALTGIKMLVMPEGDHDVSKNPIVRDGVALHARDQGSARPEVLCPSAESDHGQACAVSPRRCSWR